MRKALRVSLLVMVLACSAQAGDMPFGVTNPPPPPTASSTMPTSATETDGDIPNMQPDAVTMTVLNLLQSVLSLF